VLNEDRQWRQLGTVLTPAWSRRRLTPFQFKSAGPARRVERRVSGVSLAKPNGSVIGEMARVLDLNARERAGSRPLQLAQARS